MITRNDVSGMLGNKMRNEVIKAIIRSNNPEDVAASKCDFIDWQERFEHFIRFLNEYNEWMVQQQMQQAAVLEFLRGYKK